jgi:hypothetical protein
MLRPLEHIGRGVGHLPRRRQPRAPGRAAARSRGATAHGITHAERASAFPRRRPSRRSAPRRGAAASAATAPPRSRAAKAVPGEHRPARRDRLPSNSPAAEPGYGPRPRSGTPRAPRRGVRRRRRHPVQVCAAPVIGISRSTPCRGRTGCGGGRWPASGASDMERQVGRGRRLFGWVGARAGRHVRARGSVAMPLAGLEVPRSRQPRASWSIRAAMMKSLRVRPPAACVVSENAARPQPSSMSG